MTTVSASSSSDATPDRENGKRNKQLYFPIEWESLYFFTNDNGKAVCLICANVQNTSKKFNLERHMKCRHPAECALAGEDRERRLAELKAEFQTDQVVTQSSEDVVRVSYLITLKMAQKGKVLTDGQVIKDCMVKAAQILCPNKTSKFEAISLSRSTVIRRIEDMAGDLVEQLKERAKSFIHFSIALDESTDVSDTAQLAIYIRGVDKDLSVTEELLDLVPMKDTTTAEDIFQCVVDSSCKMGLRWESLTSVATDGAAAMVGVRSGVVFRIKEKVRTLDPNADVIGVHCLLHRENLCAKNIHISKVMNVVIKTINFIRAQGLNHRQFKVFLEEMEAEYGDIPYYSEVRWLSRGHVLQRFFQLREEIGIFMEMKGKPVPELQSAQWVADLAFYSDLTMHLNALSTALQGENQVITELFDLVTSFMTKLQFWEDQLGVRNTAHFTNLLLVMSDEIQVQSHIEVIQELHSEFQGRFQDIAKLEPLFQMFATPFSVDCNTAPTQYQMELIDLKCNRMLKEKYRSCNGDILTFYSSFPRNRFPNLHTLAAKVLSMFGTTYLCESFFSLMKLVKPRLRGKLTDSNLTSTLRVMCAHNLSPNIDELVRRRRCQVSS